jgi:hypothetical protein
MNLPNELIEKIVSYLPYEIYMKIYYEEICEECDNDLEKIWEYVMFNNLVDIVRYLVKDPDNYSANISEYIHRMACSSGNIDIVKCIFTNIPMHEPFELKCVVEYDYGNSLKIVQWICENIKEIDYYDAIYCAMENNMLDVVKYLHELKVYEKYNEFNLNRVVYSRNVELVKFVYENMYSGALNDMVYKAIERGNKETIQYLLNICGNYPKGIMNQAAKYNHLEIVKWLHNDDKCTDKFTKYGLEYAITKGYIYIVEFIIENYPELCENFPYGGDICIHANNLQEYLKIIKFIKQNNYTHVPCNNYL